jgi:predicted MFS family arabinose efflux permease
MGPVAGMAGPFLGGFLVDHMGWRTIFGPIALAGLIALLAVRKQVPTMHRHLVQPGFLRTFDWGGVMLLSVTTTMVVFYVSSRPITGIEALRDWRLLTAALFFLGSFIIWEKRQGNPFVAFDMFADKNFSLASFGAGIRMFTMTSLGFLIPLYLTDIYGLRAAAVGIIVTLHAAALLLTMRRGGQWADRLGSRWPVIIGSSVQVGIMVYFALLPETASLALIVIGLIGHGLGAGLSLAALHRASMSNIVPKQRGMAAGLYSMIRFEGIAFGAALGGVMLQYGLEHSLSAIEAYQFVFRCVAGVAALGVVSGLGLRNDK